MFRLFGPARQHPGALVEHHIKLAMHRPCNVKLAFEIFSQPLVLILALGGLLKRSVELLTEGSPGRHVQAVGSPVFQAFSRLLTVFSFTVAASRR